ncbi:MAG: rRNA maturation RNase YbeY [Chitinophagaceae bacterium]|nr:rRNA maturation RNase YbeY [Chitinophagaceae bacterium]
MKSKLSNKRMLSSFIDNQIKKTTKKTAALQYVFVSDDALLQMNQQFLHHDTFTDIITFDLSESPDKINGEIYISIDRVTENANKFSTAYTAELHRVIFHGALHLCGYKDKTKADKETMRAMEDKWLKAYLQVVNN